MALEHSERSAEESDGSIRAVQTSTVERIERCVGGALKIGLDLGRGTLNVGAYTAGGIIGTVREMRRAYDKGLGRKPYSGTKG